MTLKPKWTSGLVGEYERSLKQLKTPEQPPQRTWVGLTDEEIGEISVKSQDGISPHDDTLRFARAIEAALRSKNT